MINVVCAVISDEQGRLLVCRRAAGMALAGKWEFPGGKIEQGEIPEAALAREIREELDCVIKVRTALPMVEHHYSEFSIRLMPYRCKITSGKPTPVEHESLRWVGRSDGDGLDWADADIPIWQALHE